ncbi:cyclic nucleotide-binding domain-containing protein [Betaproteobacteria bacterium PRO7]|jgi:CRP/FNR family transcriptional regulator|nr:cyclic nucleotide-binding domain-containing protein [Betaproteobacteria bacterium PRO7]
MGAPRVGIDGRPLACSNCRLRAACMAPDGASADAARFDELVATRIRLPRRAALYFAGDRCEFVYAVRIGSLKSVFVTAEGREQVTGFHVPGEWVGLDGIASGRYSCDVVALEEADVCAIPYARLLEFAESMPPLADRLSRVLSREIAREQRALAAIGGLRARERLALFLLDLSERLGACGRPVAEFVLHMSREEIAGYLGLRLETVCRCLSQLAAAGLIGVRHKRVRIIDAPALRACALDRRRYAERADTRALASMPSVVAAAARGGAPRTQRP